MATVIYRFRHSWTIWGIAAAYILVLSLLSVLRYHYWIATGWDLGFFQQGLWLLSSQGLHAYSSMAGYPVLADTASFVLVALAPLYHWGGTPLLLLLQALALGLGYPAILRLATAMGVANRPAHLLGLIYLMYPALWGAGLYDFHPDTLAVPLFFWALILLERQRLTPALAVLLAATLVKDLAALAVMGLGIALILRRRVGWGICISLLGAAVLGFDVFFFIPQLLHQPMAQWTWYYGQWGQTPEQGIANFLVHPWLLFSWVTQAHPWRYLGYLLAPLLAVLWGRRAWRSPYWVPAGIIAEINLLSSFTPQISPYNQFSLFIIPFAFAAALDVLRQRPGTFLAPRLWLVIPALFLVVVAYREVRFQADIIPPNIQQIQAAASLIPARAPLVAQNYLVPHLANRPSLQDTNTLLQNVGSNGPQLSPHTYVFLDTATSTGSTPPQELQQFLGWLQANRAELLYASQGVLLYRTS